MDNKPACDPCGAFDEAEELFADYRARINDALDRALPPENLEGMDELIEDLALVEVPDCGHFVPWEAPEKVNAALDDFLGRTG